MQPTGAEIEQLQHALLQAYHFDDFRTMLRTGLDVDLEQVVPLIDRNFTQIVYGTVRWAAAQEGGFLRLGNAALAANQTNPDLQAFVARYANTTFDVLPLPSSGGIQAPPPAPIALPFETVTILAGPFLMGSKPGPGIPVGETPQFELVLEGTVSGSTRSRTPSTRSSCAARAVWPDQSWSGTGRSCRLRCAASR